MEIQRKKAKVRSPLLEHVLKTPQNGFESVENVWVKTWLDATTMDSYHFNFQINIHKHSEQRIFLERMLLRKRRGKMICFW